MIFKFVTQSYSNQNVGGEVAQCQRVRVSMVCDQEIDGSRQLYSICFDHVSILLAILVSPTCSAGAANFLIKGSAMYCHVYLDMRVKDP